MRADKFFAEKYGSRTKAQEALARGLILCDGTPISPKTEVKEGLTFTFLSPESAFVSNGGYKLERGMKVFEERAQGKVYADLGASTGGFTDCLLQRGAKRVYCVDVGKSQLAPSLAENERVVVMDERNARYLTKGDFPEELDGIVSDLSFISLRLILPVVASLLNDGGRAIVLLKPQFECGGRGLNKRGILPVRLHRQLLKDFYGDCVGMALNPLNVVNAPLREKKNVEYVVLLGKGGKAISEESFLQKAEKFFENPS